MEWNIYFDLQHTSLPNVGREDLLLPSLILSEIKKFGAQCYTKHKVLKKQYLDEIEKAIEFKY